MSDFVPKVGITTHLARIPLLARRFLRPESSLNLLLMIFLTCPLLYTLTAATATAAIAIAIATATSQQSFLRTGSHLLSH